MSLSMLLFIIVFGTIINPMTVITRVVYVQPEKKNGSNAFQEIEQDSAGFFNFQPNSSIDQRKLCSAPLPHLTTINNVIDRGYSKQQCLLASDSTTTGLGNNPKPISYMCLAADTTTIKLWRVKILVLSPRPCFTDNLLRLIAWVA